MRSRTLRSGLLALVTLAGCGEETDPPVTSPHETGLTGSTGVPTPTDGTFRALTYNVHGLPDAITGDDGEARMRGIAPLLEGFDLVGIQETFDEARHELLVSEATHPVHVRFDETVEAGRVYGSGLAVLARAELVEVFEEHYTTCNGLIDDSSDCLASKGFQVVRLRLGDAELDVYNTHHEAGGSVDDEVARAAQVEQVIASIEGRSAGRAVLFMGDTNLRPSDPPDAELLERYASIGLRDACLEVLCPETDHIDRFLLRDSDALGLVVEAWANEPAFYDADGVPLSDHPAISADLRWERLGAAPPGP